MNNIKYIKEEHYNKLMDEGSIRIGTLMNFRSSEHGEMVSDSMEGSKRFKGSYNNLHGEQIRQNTILNNLFGSYAYIKSVKMENVIVQEPNYFIFSFSNNYCERAHQKWYEKEKYNYCYKLITPNTFFRRITRELNHHYPVKFLGLHEVHYYEEKEGMDCFDKLHNYPAFSLKDRDDFSDQTEIRAVWQPLLDKPITPIILNIPYLSSYVEFYKSI